jgi:protein phosphatase
MSGKNNEDRYAVVALRIEGERPLPVVFAVVSDGIGGHRAGEVAAETAVETLTQVVAHSDGSRPAETLYTAVRQASQAIYLQSQEDIDKHGMGATCACALVIDNHLFTVSVGDSRIFLLRGDGIRQLSIDHTWVQEALDAGLLTPEQVSSHPNAHVIRRYLGSQQVVEPDLRVRLKPDESDEQMLANQGLQLEAGDQIVLCSDGLTDLVSPEEILTTMKNAGQKEALETLSNLANQRGGHDNITIIALQKPVTVAELAPTVPLPTARRGLSRTGCLAGILAALLLMAIAVGGFLFVAAGLPGDPTLTPRTASPAATSAAARTATGAVTVTITGTPTPLKPLATPSVGVTASRSTPAPGGPTITPWPTSTR